MVNGIVFTYTNKNAGFIEYAIVFPLERSYDIMNDAVNSIPNVVDKVSRDFQQSYYPGCTIRLATLSGANIILVYEPPDSNKLHAIELISSPARITY